MTRLPVVVAAVVFAAVATTIAVINGPTTFHSIFWPASAMFFMVMSLPRKKTKLGPVARNVTSEEIDEASQALSSNLAIIGGLRERIDEAAQGYRRKLDDMGYSPAVAEQLAAQYHSILIANLSGGKT